MPFADIEAPSATDDHVELSTIGGGVATAEPAPIQGSATWGDVGLAAKSSVPSAEAVGSSLFSTLARTPEEARYWQQKGEAQRFEAKKDTDEMTPAGQAAREGHIWSHPFVVGAEGALPLAVQVAPAIAGGAVAGPIGAAIGGGLAGAAYSAGQSVSDFTQQVIDTPEDELMKIPAYADKINSGIDPHAAKLEYAKENSGKLAAQSAAIGGATALPFAEFGGAGLPRIATSPLVDIALRGGTDAAIGAAQGGLQAAASGEAGSEAGIRKPVTAQEIFSGAGEGALSMAPIGIGGATFHRLTSGAHGDNPVYGKSAPPKGGEANSTRSNTEYRTPEAKQVVPVDIDTPPENKVPPPAPTPVDATIAAGLKGEPVTQGVTEQPKVVQPETVVAPPVQEAPQRIAEPPATTPAPIPDALPAAPDALQPVGTGVAVPETPETLAAQHQALLDPNDDREAMLYAKGQQPIEIVDKKNFGQVKLKDGSIVQYDKNGPSGFTPDKIRGYLKDNRLNEALGLGPVTKTEALQRATAGEPSVAVTERTPDGTPVKDAAGTTATAPDQIAALDAAKPPENTLEVRPPEDVLAERQSEVAQAPVVQPAVVEPSPEVTQQVIKTPFGPGRVLEDMTPEGIRAREAAAAVDARQAQTVQDQLIAKEAAKQAAEAEAAPKRVHTSKEAQAKTTADNIAAKRITDKHAAPEVLDNVKRPTEIYNRAKAMVDEAEGAGVKIPKEFPPGHPHSPAMLKLREAKDLITGKDKKWEAYARFLDREKLVDVGKGEEAFETRRNEGARGQATPEGATEERVIDKNEIANVLKDADHPENQLLRAEEERAAEAAGHIEPEEHGGEHEAPEERPPDIFQAAREERERKIAAARAESEALRKAAPAPKTAVGFKQEVRKTRPIKRAMMGENESNVPHGRAAEGAVIQDEDGNPVAVSAPRRVSTAEEAIKEHYDPKAYDKETQQMHEHLIEGLSKYAGDIPVHYLSKGEMGHNFGEGVQGLYTEDINGKPLIFLAEGADQQTAIHETLHGATAAAFDRSPKFQKWMQRLHKEVQDSAEYKNLSDNEEMSIGYPMSNPEEFLVGMMTNPRIQRLLKSVKISEQLARDIGIPKWRKMTAWNAVLHSIQKALGLSPRDVSAIEAAMSISEQAMWQHPRAVGDLMEAVGRGNRAELPSGQPKVSLAKLRFSKEDPPERDQNAFLKSPAEHIKNIVKLDKDMAKQFAKDHLDNTKVGFMAKSAKLLSGTHLADIHKKLFTDAKGNILHAITYARNKIGHTYNKLRDADKDTVQRGYLLDRTYASHMGDYGELMNMSARYNIHADRDAPSVPKNAHDAPRKDWQRNQYTAKAKEIYDNLPSELQKRYRNEKQFYMNKQKELATTVLDKTLPILDLPKDMEDRVRNNNMTDDDWDKLREMEADKPIENAHRLINKKDVYLAGDRGGDHMFTGKYEMPKGGKDTDATGEKLPDNKREFDTEAEAHKYVTDTHMPAAVRETNYWTDPATGKTERKSAGEAASSGTMSKKYEVSLERQHTEFHETPAEAAKARAEAEKAGVGELSQVMNRRDDKSWSSITSGGQAALERRIRNRDNLSSAEKEHLIHSTRMLAVGQQGGMSPHLLQSRKVAGARYNAQALDNYSKAINNHIARNAHQAELNQAMTRLDEHENANRTGEGATTRSIIGNEMRDRVYKDPNVGSTKVSPFLHKLMTYSFINFLVRPSHIFLSQVHPYVYSVPMMGARHGYWKAMNAQRQAMKDLGGQLGNLKRGAKAGLDIARSVREKDIDKAVELAHGADPIHDMIARLSDKGERDYLNDLYETGHLHSAYDQSTFSGGGLDRGNAMMGQFTNAMEANNRLSTALAAYRLEKGMHADHGNATAYGRRVIEETHGVYSAGNTAPIFKNPLLRATLQFHQQPMNLAIKLYHNIGKAAKGDKEAAWTLAYQLGTAALLGGMGGMPLDLPKLAGVASSAVGGDGPDEYMDKLRRTLVATIGQEATNVLMEGLPGLMGPLGPSLGHRMGFDAGLLSDAPKSGKGADVMSWAAKQVAGAPGSVIMQWLDGLHALEQGDPQKAAEAFLPGSLRDFAKTYRLATTGTQVGGKTIRPASYGDAMLQFLGFTGVEHDRIMEGHYLLQKAIRDRPKTVQEQLKEKQRAKTQAGSVLGVKPTKENRALLGEYGRTYQ